MQPSNLYPEANWRPLVNHSEPGTLAQRNLIVLHITQGPTADGAIATFAASVAPHRVSAHFVVDRGGTVTQLLDVSETAWHASQVNWRSVGVEHAAMVESLPATEAQYRASAALVAWLCRLLHAPCDRVHVQGHNEASPADGHTLCPSGALDVDRLVGMAAAL